MKDQQDKLDYAIGVAMGILMVLSASLLLFMVTRHVLAGPYSPPPPQHECSGACGENFNCNNGCYCLIVDGVGSCVSY